MAGKLPKVTEYIKNVGKSVGYAAIDSVKEPTENISDFMETNEDLFKVIYSATKNYKQTLKTIDRSIKRSKIYEAGQIGLQNIREDLKTGRLYNKQREEQLGMEGMMGTEFADFSEFDSDSLSNLSWDDEDGDDSDSISSDTSVTVKAMSQTAGDLGKVIASSSNIQNEVILASADSINKTNMATAKLMSMHTEKIHTSLISGFGGVNAGMNLITSIMNGPMTKFMNESTKFYGDVNTHLTDIAGYMKEMTEMQRNLYKAQETQWKNSKFDEVVGASGAPDLTAYAKRIYKNIMDLDPTGGMLSGGDSDENIFKAFVGSPLKAIPQMIAKLIVPTAVTKTLQAFDENMSGLFSAFIARMNKYAEDEVGDFNIRGILGTLLGIKIDRKNSIDTSRYTRGPIPFDGETKKAIVDVIPAYLARIESAVSGMPERVFDGQSGKFRTVKDVHRSYKSMEEQGWMDAVSSISEPFDRWAREHVDSMNISSSAKDREYKQLKENLKKLGKRIYDDGGDFRPYSGIGPRGDRRDEDNPYIEIFGDEDWMNFMRYMERNHKKNIYEISRNTIDSIQRRNREIERNEGGFANPYSILFNDSLNVLDEHGRLRGLNANGKDIYSKNSRFKSATDYLKDILAEVRWIRTRGVRGGTGTGVGSDIGGPHFISTPNGLRRASDLSFDEWKEYTLGDDTYEDVYEREEKNHWKEAKEKTLAEKYGLTREGFANTDVGKEVTSTWDRAKKKVDELLKSPAKWAVEVIHRADERIFEAMFGNKSGETFRDKHGLEYRGFLDYLVSQAEDIFDSFKDKMKASWQKFSDWFFEKTKVGRWAKDHGKAFISGVGNKLKNKFMSAKDRLGQAFGRYRSAYSRMRQGEIISAEDLASRYGADTYTDQYLRSRGGVPFSEINNEIDYDDIFNPDNFAYGGMVRKYGLTMLSPGEIVIPNPTAAMRKKNLAGEKREKNRILQALRSGKIQHNAEGTQGQQDPKKEENKVFSTIKKIMREIGGEGTDVVADALIGGGVSLLTGMVGGPLLGAAVGAGFGVVKNSTTVQKALFGEDIIEEDDKGNRIKRHKGGIISKKTQDVVKGFFKKNGSDMIDFGIAGGIAGLFTPLGLVGGILAGSGLGFVKNTTWFQEMMFGNEVTGKQGLMSPETKKKLQKALPAMGIGSGAAILTGPFGLVGNAVLGSAAGYIVTSDKFKELILGKDDGEGKRKGGLVNAVYDGFVKPLSTSGKNFLIDMKDFAKKSIIDPTKNFVEGLGQSIRNAFLTLGDKIADKLSGMFDKRVGMPLEEFMREKVFKKIAGGIGTLLKVPVGIGKAVIGAPFKVLGGIGNSMKANAIARGKMDTMTAAQRLEFRRLHGFRFNKLKDKTKMSDEMLAQMSSEELEALGSNLNKFIGNRGASKIAYMDLVESTRNNISNFIAANGLQSNDSYNMQRDILRLMQSDDLTDRSLNSLISKYGLTSDQAAQLAGLVDVGGLNSARSAMINEAGMSKDAINKLESLTGNKLLHKGKNVNLRRYNRLIATELKARKAADASNGFRGQEALPPEEKLVSNTSKIIKILIAINKNLVGNDHIDIDEKDLDRPSTPSNAGQSDTREATEERQRQEEEQEQKSWFRKKFEEFFGTKEQTDSDSEEEDEENKSLLSKILGGAGSAFSGVFGGVKKSAGFVAAITGGAIGLSMLGYGSQFLKEKVTPWLKENVLPMFSGVYEKFISPIINGLKDGSLVTALVAKMTQGITFAVKNVVAPLTGAIIRAFPDLMIGIAKGIGLAMTNIFSLNKTTTNTDYSKYINSATKTMINPKDEAEFAKNFSGSVYKGESSISSEIDKAYKSITVNKNYATGTTTLGNGNTVTNENGIVTMKDGFGNVIGEYDAETGELITTSVSQSRGNMITRGTWNALKRSFATGSTAPGILKPFTKLAGKISNKGIGANFAKSFAGGGIFSKAINAATGVVKTGIKATDIGARGAAKIGGNVSKFLKSGVSAITEDTGLLANIVKKIEKFFGALGNNSVGKWVLSALKGSVTNIDEGILKKLFDKLGTAVGKLVEKQGLTKLAGTGASKLLKALGNATPLGLVFWTTSLVNGFNRAESLLGVAKDTLEITTPMRVMVAIAHAINENLLLGIIPTQTIMETVIKIFGSSLSIDAQELEAAQELSAGMVTAANLESGGNMTLEQFNGQEGWFQKASRNVKGFFTKNRGVETSITTTGKGRSGYTSYYGRGRGGQQGGIFSNMRYGNTTIGEAGCAPVAAASMLGGNIPEAARYAQRTGHVAPDGSTDIGFFNDYFSAKGISNTTTTSKSDVARALKNGNSAVLLGRDPGGGVDSAYSDSSHYITARGDRRGNVIVNDPALGVRRMSQSKVLKNMKASVITGRGRGYGGDDNTIGGTIYRTSNNAQKIVDTARSQKNIKEGYNNDNKYGKEYGNNHEPWCCMFVWWVFKHAGASSLFYGGGKCASCTTLMDFYRQNGQLMQSARAGDIVFFNFNSNFDRSIATHVGICVKNSDGMTVTCVEGNTSSGDSGSQDNGGGVYERTRDMKHVVGIARPAYNGATFDDPIPDSGYYNYETGETESRMSTLFDKIINLGKLAVKSIFGEGLYTAVFGDDTSSSSSSGVTGLDNNGNLVGSDNSEKIWRYLRSMGYSKEATAAIMGSLVNESGLKSNNLQDTYNKSLGYSDSAYTDAVNKGFYSRSKFTSDEAGYGLAQWTYGSRKASLYDATVSKGRSVDNLKDQLDLLNREVSETPGLGNALKNATSISDANKLFISGFEKPYGYENENSAHYSTRLDSAHKFYNQYKGTGRGYKNRINTNLINESGRARNDVNSPAIVTGSGTTVSYAAFLEAIVNILMSISDNTDALTKILDILSKNFNINIDSSDVKKSASSSKKNAREALNRMMGNKADAEELSNILQTKNTEYLISVMTDIARE